MKKNGFTLIEVLVSIVIFGIILTCVYSSYAFSFKVFKSCDTNTYIQLYAKTILSNFKQKDNSYIKSLYSSAVKNENGLAGEFINFNDANELITGLNELSFSKSILSGTIAEAKLQNAGKNFTAFCGISKSNSISLGFETYTLVIRVTDNNSKFLIGVENEKDFVVFD